MEETPTGAFGRQLERSRRRRGWSQEELADRADMSRLMINRIETRARGRRVDLDEALRLSFVLDVCPLHLIVPREDDGELRVTGDDVLDAPGARDWIRGTLLPKDPIEWGADEWGDAIDVFETEVPPGELRVLRGPLRTLHHRAQNILQIVEALATSRSRPRSGDWGSLEQALELLEDELERVKRTKPDRRKEAPSGSRSKASK